MDCESDESERWEDFFGSSTDISPSVIAYYDRLSSSTDDTNSLKSLNNSKSTIFSDTNSSCDNNSLLDYQQSAIVNVENRCESIATTNEESTVAKPIKLVPPPLPKLPPPPLHRRCRNFRALSANVQRLISHSNTSLHPDDMNENQSIESLPDTLLSPNTGLKQNFNRGTNSSLHGIRQNVQYSSLRTLPSLVATTTTSNNSKFKHPLSKNTSKLTQSGGTSLIIDDSDGGYVTPPESICQFRNGFSDIENGNGFNHDRNDENDDKTPTNEYPPSSIDSTSTIELHIANDTNSDYCNQNGQHETIEDDIYEDCVPIDKPSDSHIESSNVLPKNVKSFIHSMISKSSDTSFGEQNENKVQKSPTPSNGSATSESKTIKSQLFAIRAQNNEKSTKKTSTSSSSCSSGDVPAADQSIASDNDDNNNENTNNSNGDSNTNNDNINKNADNADGESKSNPVVVPNESSNSKQENGESKIELKRMKVRPLSSVSISSTSSSSSSASDEHSSNQNAISYLASVESLADHSENEFALGNSLTVKTVTERSCLEIVDSERSYVDDLGQVIKGYLNDWKERACLKDDDLHTLFGNIQEVYDFNVILLRELEQSGMEPAKIAKCFIKLQDQFDAYTQYCTCYPDAISLLTTLLQASHTNALLTSTQKTLQHTLPLGSYLLKPVQRILKYHLLLDNLRKHCDVVEVVQAHEIMKNVARHIDQVKRNLEQQSRVRELSGILDGWLGPELTVLGDLIFEGPLLESNKPRIVLLFETMLIITKKKEDNRLQFKTYIHCKNLMLIEHFPGEQASFSVIPYNDMHPNQIKLTARNRDQKRQWAQHIKQVMLAHFDIPNRAKELLFKLGEEEDRTPDKNTWKWNNSSSNTTPEYLERRNQYRRSEMRTRSKKQRKIFNTSLSMVEDSFDKFSITSNDSGKTKALDSMIKELQERNSLIKQSDNDSVSQCGDVEEQKNGDAFTEDELPFDANKALPSKPASALDKAKSKLLEVRMYNTKTLPKRIANLKKQRSKTLKVTSQFYMDLPEENTDTVLKITESTDDIAIDDVRVNRRRASLDATDTISKAMEDNPSRKLSSVSLMSPISLTSSERIKNDKNKNKRDIDIISELLKDHKEFDRILKKPPKKCDGDKSPSHDIRNLKFPRSDSFLSSLNSNIMRLPLPPIPTEANDQFEIDKFDYKPLPPEPIYESLLRNVHVPYRFPSPVLSRSLSQPNARFLKVKRPTEAPPKRPDSDYVMLTYSENGELTNIDDEVHLPKHSNFRKSDTNINYHTRRSFDEITPSIDSLNMSLPNNKDESHGDVSSETDYSVSGSSIRTTVSTDFLSALYQSTETVQTNDSDGKVNDDLHKNNENLHFNKSTNKLPERRVSDVTGMHRKSIIHKQGSRTLGSRIASNDYADPKILFAQQTNNSYQQAVNNKTSNIVQVQRDSVFSLTSSNDSMNTSSNFDGSPKFQNDQKLPSIIVTDSKTSSRNISPVRTSNNGTCGSSSSSSGDDSYYEKTVETCLENDNIFRDSAIYSDDNNEKTYMRPEHIYSTIDEVKQIEKEKPIPPPKLNTKKIQSIVARAAPPPPLPTKPAFVAPISPNKIHGVAERYGEKQIPNTIFNLTAPIEAANITPMEESTTNGPDTANNESKSKEFHSTANNDVTAQKRNIQDEIDISLRPLPPVPCLTKLEQHPITPPPIPARTNLTNSKNSSWVLKQIQNFDK